jgi:hypothetical protein
MKDKDVFEELSSIRELMERSSKFISLSGLAGVLAGIYALIGARFAFRIIDNVSVVTGDVTTVDVEEAFGPVLFIAIIVLLSSIVTASWLSIRKARSRNENAWNPVSRRLLTAISIPLVTGGVYVSIMVWQSDYHIIAPACLIFYGLALFAGGQYTYNEVRWLGIGEILLGLLATALPVYGLLFWAIGFGLLHIIYGSIMHFKYER